ncbi:leucine-rich_repeat domain-containing protein [Hexamita inflata]|uniref:Leucine-rich repeat domain-containing protein n=1 Tax=Hexamita inflata TaxID=28002 RepID=A0AA86UCY1_9EUKA|nr:leucine-rich repeat domain-containing protein [Hexamita inflata]
MQPNQIIRSKEELINHFGSSKTLEILDLEQMKILLEIDVPPEIWKDASNRNLLSFSQEFVQETEEFKFYGRSIEHIYLVSFLTNLTELNLSENNISDISTIYKLKNLKKLDLRDNCIKDISALQSFTDQIQLAELDLQNNNISDISSISKLKNLKELDLRSNSIEDISALQSLPDLTHLYLQQTRITSYTLALPNLVYLKLGYNKLQDISGLKHSPKLETLNLYGTETADLRAISRQLFGLKDLYLQSNNLTELSYLSNFVDLQILYLNDNKQLQNIGPLKFCTQLTEFSISKTNVADIWPIQFMKNLKTLDIDNTKVVDLHPLQHLNKLENISAPYSGIIDVSPLSKLTQLNYLYFWNSKITNGETLKHHKNFSKYNLTDQEVPTPDELKFYNKVLSVHNSQEQIRKIYNENRVSKFKEQLTHQKESIKIKINEQIRAINMKIEIWAQFIQNSYADQ